MSDPENVYIGLGAVLYDDRPPERRDCCRDGGRCLHHVTEVYHPEQSPDRLLEVECGTHTVRFYLLEPDVRAMFTPAGWRWPTTRKPTYHLTRSCGVEDRHDLMQRADS